MRVRMMMVLIGLAVGRGVFSRVARADPLPGEVLKFQQLPEVVLTLPSLGGLSYYGHDELSTIFGPSPAPGTPPLQGRFMADDFADRFDTPVLHVRWWGSYMGPDHFVGTGVKQFYIGFEEDVPVSASQPFSRPGKTLLQQFVNKGPMAPGSGTFTETLIRGPDPVIGESVYQYNAELACPFPERHDTVYWLKIAAMVDQTRDGSIQWGWHNRDWYLPDALASTAPAVDPGEKMVGTVGDVGVWHFQDDAVQGTLITQFLNQCSGTSEESDFAPTHYLAPQDGPPPIDTFSKDLAFELYTVPEPGVMALGMGAAVLMLRRRR